jgi:aryl-alcohol dehydrogenase-like predicted oxidoreductase
MFFDNSPALRDVQRVETLRPILTADGRSLPQAALGWIWARSPITIPIPGFKTLAHVEDNAGAAAYGPLSDAQMAAIEQHLRPHRD